MIAADNNTRLVLATDFGYGFVTRFEALLSRNKAGKQIISLTDGARILAPQASADPARDRIVVVTSEGHLLMFSVAELPELDKGKGNKLIEIPRAKRLSGEERVARSRCTPGSASSRYAGRTWSSMAAHVPVAAECCRAACVEWSVSSPAGEHGADGFRERL